MGEICVIFFNNYERAYRLCVCTMLLHNGEVRRCKKCSEKNENVRKKRKKRDINRKI